MPLVQINADLTATNKILERLTRVMERLLLAEYGIRLGHCAEPAVDPNPSEKPSVSYHTDTDTLREELKTLVGYQPSTEEEEEDKDEFGV